MLFMHDLEPSTHPLIYFCIFEILVFEVAGNCCDCNLRSLFIETCVSEIWRCLVGQEISTVV